MAALQANPQASKNVCITDINLPNVKYEIS